MKEEYDEFICQMADLNKEKVLELTRKRVEAGEDIFNILEDMRIATDIIGERFENGWYFISDLIMAGEILKGVMNILNPFLSKKVRKDRKGKIAIGTVKGDIHDIGKNIVIALLEAEGFEVVDLGVDVPPEVFVDCVKKHNPHILALSGLLTEAIESMKKTIDAIKEAGVRKQLKVIIGGGRIDEEARRYTGADEWSDDAVRGVKKIKNLTGVY